MSLTNGIDAAQPTSALAPKAEVIDPSRFFREVPTTDLGAATITLRKQLRSHFEGSKSRRGDSSVPHFPESFNTPRMFCFVTCGFARILRRTTEAP